MGLQSCDLFFIFAGNHFGLKYFVKMFDTEINIYLHNRNI